MPGAGSASGATAQSQVSGEPAMAGDQHAIVSHQHWIREAELGDRAGSRRDLILRMGALIACMRDQSLKRPSLNLAAKWRGIDLSGLGSVVREGGNR